jgi:hypothetical protein
MWSNIVSCFGGPDRVHDIVFVAVLAKLLAYYSKHSPPFLQLSHLSFPPLLLYLCVRALCGLFNAISSDCQGSAVIASKMAAKAMHVASCTR